MCTVPISSEESHLDLLEKIATSMKRPNAMVEIGYEAPWSAKIGTKKCVAYLSNEDDLTEFWSSFASYVRGQGKKKWAEGSVPGIVFQNMIGVTQVSERRVPCFMS